MMRRVLFSAVGIVLALLACELLLRLLPVSTATYTGYYLTPEIISYPPQQRWTTSTGWDLRNVQRAQANNRGFLAGLPFERNPQALALVGDSMVEASMLDGLDRPDAQLGRALAGRPVFALGGPGSSLLDYVERIRWAGSELGVRDFVVLMERGDLMQSLCGSGNNHGPCLDRGDLSARNVVTPPAGTVKQILRHSALAQYLVGQLKLSPQRLWQQARLQARPQTEPGTPAGLAPAPAPAALDPAERVVAEEFFRRVKPLVAGRLVLLLDADRQQIYRGPPLPDPRRVMLEELAAQNGVTLVDLAPAFRANYAQQGLKFEVGPYDGHYNRLGVAVAMQAAARALR